ncbi:MAG: hypothetical protein D6E12_15495 [Desulfovibrio sp.]|mgnify:CR=1 FL=1|nr:MAG: hypothetical protein D6E12_15495 [Desulfovibrio sp.]
MDQQRFIAPGAPCFPLLREKNRNAVDLDRSDHAEQEPDHGEKGVFLACHLCLNPITRQGNRIAVNGQHQHNFFNPHGLVFEIGCFSAAPGCVIQGAPSFEFTWFPGHAWQVALCSRCLNHLGWQFTGPGGSQFFGLIVGELVELDGDESQ